MLMSECSARSVHVEAAHEEDAHSKVCYSKSRKHGGNGLQEKSSPVSPAAHVSKSSASSIRSENAADLAKPQKDEAFVGLASHMRIQSARPKQTQSEKASSELQPMHSYVDSRLFVAHVRRSATAKQLADHFFLSEAEIKRNWALSWSEELRNQKSHNGMLQPQYTPVRLAASSCAHAVDPDELRDALGIFLAKADVRWCGFSLSNCHPGLRVSCQRKRVRKHMLGLFCTVRTRAALTEADIGCTRYVEFELPRSVCARGVCVGVGAEGLPLDKMVGSNQSSLGFYTTGDFVRDNRWEPYSQGFGAGDVVGMRIQVVHSSRAHDGADLLFYRADVTLFVNGKAVRGPQEDSFASRCLELPYGTTLFCYVSMHGERSVVRLRCCRHELLASPTAIGAPSLSLCADPIDP